MVDATDLKSVLAKAGYGFESHHRHYFFALSIYLNQSTNSRSHYEVRPRKDHRGVNLISDALPFGLLWYIEADDDVEYAKFFNRSDDAVIRVYDEAGNVIQANEHRGDFREW
jgi:hypothetical protein